MASRQRGKLEYLQNLMMSGLIGVLRMLPYRTRVHTMGWIVSRIVAPLVGLRKRFRDQWVLVAPDMPEDTLDRLTRKIPDNFGRLMIEIFSGEDFRQHVGDLPFSGAGVAAIKQAKDTGRPVILVSGHFGNYEAARAALSFQGYTMGGLYTPMKNGYFNDHYVDAMTKLGNISFESTRRGVAEMVKFLKDGNFVGMLIDLHVRDGVAIDFLGRPAQTSLTAAKLALKYDALIVPFYGKRHPDGIGFDIVFNAPIPHSDPLQMTKDMSADLESMIRASPEQWFWAHRRWRS